MWIDVGDQETIPDRSVVKTIQVCMRACVCVSLYASVCVRARACVRVCLRVHAWVCVCARACVRMCMCVFSVGCYTWLLTIRFIFLCIQTIPTSFPEPTENRMRMSLQTSRIGIACDSCCEWMCVNVVVEPESFMCSELLKLLSCVQLSINACMDLKLCLIHQAIDVYIIVPYIYIYNYINGGGRGGGVILEYLMRLELICCPMRGVIELGSVKPPCMPHLSPDGGRWGNTLIGA